MPALPAAPGVLKITVPMTLEGDPFALNRFFFHYDGTAPTPTQLATFADVVSTAWGARLATLANANVTQQTVNVEDLSSSTGAVANGSTTHVGTRTGAPIAAGSCVMIQFLIARRYRGGKPKIFLPFGVAADLTGSSTWGATFLGNVATGWGQFIADISAAMWTGSLTIKHVNVSYYEGFTVVTNPITHRARNVPTLRGAPVVDTVVGYGTENSVASQRRRNQV
jgi:hypothetical protein